MKMRFIISAIFGVIIVLHSPLVGRGKPIRDYSEQLVPTTVFAQPVLTGIRDNVHVPVAEHSYPTNKSFNLVLWQPNPAAPAGQLVPTTWNAGDMTGFYPDPPLKEHQAAFRELSRFVNRAGRGRHGWSLYQFQRPTKRVARPQNDDHTGL